jgi:HEAT repeats
MHLFAIAVLALAAANGVLLLALAGRRLQLGLRARRIAELGRRVRPVALAFLDDDPAPVPSLSLPEQEVLADTLGGYARSVRGRSRERITAYFEEQGTVDAEIGALRTSRQAWRRAAAAQRLGDMGSPNAGDALADALDDDDWDVRLAATRSLGRLALPGAVDPLIMAIIAGKVPRSLAAWALLQIGAPTLPRIRAGLDAIDADQRAGSLQMVGLLGDGSDTPRVEKRLRDGAAEVRRQAAEALARIGRRESVDALLDALDDRIPTVRLAAAQALGRLRDTRSAAALIAHARDDDFDVALAAAYAAAAVDPEAAEAAAGDAGCLREAVDVARLA